MCVTRTSHRGRASASQKYVLLRLASPQPAGFLNTARVVPSSYVHGAKYPLSELCFPFFALNADKCYPSPTVFISDCTLCQVRPEVVRRRDIGSHGVYDGCKRASDCPIICRKHSKRCSCSPCVGAENASCLLYVPVCLL